MNASSESGLCATLISRIDLTRSGAHKSALTQGTSIEFKVAKLANHHRKCSRRLQVPAQAKEAAAATITFDTSAKRNGYSPKNAAWLPAMRHNGQPADTRRKQNRFGDDGSHGVTNEARIPASAIHPATNAITG